MLVHRLHRARVAAGLSLRDVAAATGLSQTAIAKYEKGTITPTSANLLALAKALGVRVEYFLRPCDRTLGPIEYRKRARLGAKARARIEAKVLEQVERTLELLDLYPNAPLAPFRVPDIVPERISSLDEIEDVTARIRDVWQLGHNPIADLTGTLEDIGVLVLFIPDDDDRRFDGLSATVAGWPVVGVGESWPGDRQRFTLARELGHLVLGGRLVEGLDEEKACHRFAGAFLAPADAVRHALGARRSWIEPRELYDLKLTFGLSMQAWIYRAKDLGIISASTAGHLFRSFSAHGWRKREPGPPLPSERPRRFEQLVYHALAEDLIGESKAAELLGLPLTTFRARRLLDRDVAAADRQ